MSDTAAKAPRWAIWLPLALFAGFFVLVMFGLLRPASHDVQSAMIGKPLPPFNLAPASADRPGLARTDFAGKPRLMNVFASWCVPCAAETPVLAELAKRGVEIDGIAIRDRPQDLALFLARNGNPYARIGADNVREVQLAIGSSGVPESFVIDGKGTIRYQHIGEIRPDQIDMILGKLAEAAK
ncbi:MAG: DsbE family thiol:disulfide interchange protein [Sphingomonadales bacterium]|nr:DsbE family thiol:disulfide interchange protein [Sphingomonadales bacterium]